MREILAISSIRLNGGTHHRAGNNFVVINEYSTRMRAGDTFPPIQVFFDGEYYWLADGYLRLAAAQNIGRTSIEAFISLGSCRDAIFFATSCKRDHGLPHNSGDYRHCMRILLSDNEWFKMDDLTIANHCGTSADLVINFRKTIINSC